MDFEEYYQSGYDQENDDNEENGHFKVLDEIDEIESYSDQLNEERIRFKVRTIHPINDLKEDLQYCIKKNSKNLSRDSEQFNQIMMMVSKVKGQQSNIIEKLDLEVKTAVSVSESCFC